MKTQWTLFSVMGIPVRLNLSVLLLAVYFAVTQYENASPVLSIILSIAFVVVLMLSVLLHELSHSAVAIAFGGRVRSITLQLLGGCALVTRMPQKPYQEFLMAFAGPLCSLVIAAIAWICAEVFYTTGTYIFPVDERGLYDFVCEYPYLLTVAWINIALALFNLLPAYPMDGGRMLRSALQIFRLSKVRATEIAMVVGRAIALMWVIVFCLTFFFGIDISPPEGCSDEMALCWDITIGDGYNFLRLLIAAMIWYAGKQELDDVRAEAEYYGGRR